MRKIDLFQKKRRTDKEVLTKMTEGKQTPLQIIDYLLFFNLCLSFLEQSIMHF